MSSNVISDIFLAEYHLILSHLGRIGPDIGYTCMVGYGILLFVPTGRFLLTLTNQSSALYSVP